MKIRNQRRVEKKFVWSREDHLWFQNAVEKRAYDFWLSGGCRERTGLQDWLRAECEIFEEFVRNNGRQFALLNSPGQLDVSEAGGTLPAPESNPESKPK